MARLPAAIVNRRIRTANSVTAMIATRKYNPGFLTDDELVESFCVRTNEFDSIVEILRECTGSSNPHQLVIGPRGSGKTSLLLRVAVEVRRDAELSFGFFPIVFAEESYEVSTTGEFWLECLSRLAVQAPNREEDPDLQSSYEDLRTVPDDRTLAERCLGALLDFSDREGKRLVLVVENLNMMFKDMMDRDAGWRLRKILQTEPRIILLASATSRFDEIVNPDQALYDLFRVCTLRPLDTNESAVLWETVSGQCRPPKTIRSLEILTGGSPRLLAIVARFGAELSFRELMADLLDLVDDHTEYFKSHLEALPAQERRVYLALADLWKPATTREIADRARLETSKCSAQLTRLVDRGVAQVAGGTARRKQYYLSERLYNIYYQLRRSRGPDNLVKALVNFMESFYSPPELRDISVRIALDAINADATMQSLHRTAYSQLMTRPAMAGYREKLHMMIPKEIVKKLDWDSVLSEYTRKVPFDLSGDHAHASTSYGNTNDHAAWIAAHELFSKVIELEDQNRLQESLAVCDEIVRRFEKKDATFVLELVAIAIFHKATYLSELDRMDEALAAYDDVTHRFGESDEPSLREIVAVTLVNKGVKLVGLNRLEEALIVYEEVTRRFGECEVPTLFEPVATALVNKGSTLLLLGRAVDALAVCDEAVRRFGDSDDIPILDQVSMALVDKGVALGKLNRPQDALTVFNAVVCRFGENERPIVLDQVAIALFNKGVTLDKLDRVEEALITYDELLSRFSVSDRAVVLEQIAMALYNKGTTLGAVNRSEGALAAYEELISRLGASEAPVVVEQVAKALVNKAVVLGALDRIEDALATCDEVVNRFGASKAPIIVEQVAKAMVNKGVTLGRINRNEEALAAYGDMMHQFASNHTATLQILAAKALVNKGITLGRLDREEQALSVYDEVVHRFGDSEIPALLEWTARALFLRAAALDARGQPNEALAAYEEVVYRFRNSELPTLLDLVAKALTGKGAKLIGLNRVEEALPAFDEVVSRFGTSDKPAVREQVAGALIGKAAVLAELNRPEEAVATLDDLVHRFRRSDSSTIQSLVEFALMDKADISLERGQYETAIQIVDPILDQHVIQSPQNRCRCHLIRANAVLLTSGDPSACEPDIEATLEVLPQLDSLPQGTLNALIGFGVEIGPARMRELIQASPAATLLLPLTTALELELGLDPRVAREVEEVADDIQRAMKKRLRSNDNVSVHTASPEQSE